MPISQVPARDPPAKHFAIILLGILDQSGILLGKEIFVPSDKSVATQIIRRLLSQLDQLSNRIVGARLREVEAGGITVVLRIIAEGLEARISIACTCSRFLVGPFEIFEHSRHRRMQAVEIDAVKSNAAIRAEPAVMSAKPPYEIENVGVAPHPERVTREISEGFQRSFVARRATDVPVYAVCVGEVRLDGDS